jgi:6-phosphogluconolactonase (cycloisomerase 2 family)
MGEDSLRRPTSKFDTSSEGRSSLSMLITWSSGSNGASINTWKLPLTSSSAALQTFTYTMSRPGPDSVRQDKPHPHSVFTDPTGRYLLSADLGADLIRIWSIDASSGRLTECPSFATGAGDGPRHGSFASVGDATYLYVINELGQSVSAWDVSYPSSSCLSLSHFQTLSTYPSNQTTPTNVKAAEIHVRDGFVYASNRNDESFGTAQDSIAVYAVDAASGELDMLDFTNAHGFFPRTFSINRAGTLVAVGGQTSATVAILERDASTGLLGPLVTSIAVGSKGGVNQEDGLSAVVWAD